MYFVITRPNARDSSMWHLAPRLATEDPVKALEAAREAQNDGSEDYVELILIYELISDKVYPFVGELDPRYPNLLRYLAWKRPSGDFREWAEKLLGDFEEKSSTSVRVTQ